eukprot:TRINITY_DN11427_c0_g1_i2.p3 TRINITY_DN11427_c0_g1~~TRINITY_DN11427_c0_g1_i2.p3  ORF type:complete len:112 (+),score=2.54 TRINITY_DN11427_c0_g1_i2:404-739(+)
MQLIHRFPNFESLQFNLQIHAIHLKFFFIEKGRGEISFVFNGGFQFSNFVGNSSLFVAPQCNLLTDFYISFVKYFVYGADQVGKFEFEGKLGKQSVNSLCSVVLRFLGLDY